MTGRIAAWDADKLLKLNDELEYNAATTPVLCLAGPGGDFDEAIRIVSLMMTHRANPLQEKNVLVFGTRIEAGTECLSACAFIFMAGMLCTGTGDICTYSRVLHLKAKLGFHAPYIPIPPDPQVTFDYKEFAAAHRTATIQMGRLAEAFSYPPQGSRGEGQSWIRLWLFAELLKRNPDDFYVIDSVAKAGFLDIDLDGVPKVRQLSKTMMYYACTNLNEWTGGRPAEDEIAKRYGTTSQLLTKDVTITSKSGTTTLSQQANYKLAQWGTCEIRGNPSNSDDLSITIDNRKLLFGDGETTNLVWLFLPGGTSLSHLAD
jgi:hypothetical protein